MVLWLWPLLGVLTFIFWMRRFVRAGRSAARAEILSADMRPSRVNGRVSIVMAAKDEEATIETSVSRLLAQDYRDVEIVVVNDRSEDRTPEILARLQRRARGRLRVVHVSELPAGWAGKPHAIHRAIPFTSGEWLCFTDADCRLSPNAVSLAIDRASVAGADFATIIPELDVASVWDAIVQPVCVIVLLGWARPHQASDPASTAAYANGAFMLIRRRCYEALGGHDSVRAELNEDLRLAQQAKREGFRLCVLQSRGVCRTKMYDSPRSLWRGWSRLFYGCSSSARQILETIAFVFATGVLPGAGLAISVAAIRHASPDAIVWWQAAIVSWSIAVLAQHAAVWRVYGRIGTRIGTPGFVVGSIGTIAILVNAWLKKTGVSVVTWRGTTYAARQS